MPTQTYSNIIASLLKDFILIMKFLLLEKFQYLFKNDIFKNDISYYR